VFTRALHCSLSWARSIQSIPSHPISIRSILILLTHLHLGLPSGLFPLAFPPISYMHSSSPHSCYIPCLSHPPWLDHSNYVLRGVQVMKLLVMQFPPVSRNFIPLRSKYSPQHTLSLCSSLNVRDQASRPYRTTGKIIVLYILIFTFLNSSREDKTFCTKW
jgi:hypothetical protein